MEVILRAAVVYAGLWLVFRVAGKRALRDMTTFDLLLLLLVSECAQQGLIGQDFSITGAFLAIGTLVGVDILLSLAKQRFHKVEKIVDSVPVILIEKGYVHADRLRKERVDERDILASARELHGIARMELIDYAILETNGMISVIPKSREN